MQLPEILRPSSESVPAETPAVIGRRRLIVGATLGVGAALLGGTLATSEGSTAFYVLGLLVAGTWIVGSLLSGPVPPGGPRGEPVRPRQLLAPALLGAAAFAGFLVAGEAARQIPVLSHALETVLDRADAGSLALVVVVALVNAVGEELFFRGALFTSFASSRPTVVSTVAYALVTAATRNIVLVLAAVVLGALFCVERRSTHGVLAPIVTHVVWSTLVLLALPR